MWKHLVLFTITVQVCLAKNVDEVDEFDGGIEEDEAIESQVKYLDSAREALLELGAKTRGGKNVTNAFLKVIDGFERNIANFQASLGSRLQINSTLAVNVKGLLKAASSGAQTNRGILRALTAQGLFLALTSRDKAAGNTRFPASTPHAITKRQSGPHHYILEGAIAYLKSINDDVGEEFFEKYLSINGSVTLIFAIDDTASMKSYIDGAIAIAIKIVTAKRDYAVDYILSPFNDPTTGPITVKNRTQGKEFVKALSSLRAHGGGDCAEFAFKGMIDALESGPEVGSSMYVFTDASPKDVSRENIDHVLNLAHNLDIPINFFNRGHCGRLHDVASYEKIADKTDGLVYPLKTSFEIAKIARVVVNSLRGSASVSFGGGAGRPGSGPRRRMRKQALGKIYAISVDDSIERVLVKVTTQRAGAGIILISPKGKMVTDGRVVLTRGAVYDIAKPLPGVYRLIVPDAVGQHKYRVNAVSGTNIDFGHYYVYIPSRGRNRVPVPLDQPLQGSPATVFITVAGAASVNSTSLSIKVVNKEDQVYEHQVLRPVGTSGVRYIAKPLKLPMRGAFKLELHGRTKKGNQFVRISSRQDQAAAVVLRLWYTSKPNVLLRAKVTPIRVQIRRADVGSLEETYTVALKDQRGYGKVMTPVRKVKRGRVGFAQIQFAVPAHAPKGMVEKIEVVLSKEGDMKPVARLFLSLLIV